MKKILSSIIAGALVASIILPSCSDLSVSEEKTTKQPMPMGVSFGKYTDFGNALKNTFEEKYGDAAIAREVIIADDNQIIGDNEVLTLPENEKSSDYLLSNRYISEKAAIYVEAIENTLNLDSKSEIFKNITSIEQEAFAKLTESDLDKVMYFAESTKATISYWTEDGEIARSLWSRFKKNIKNIAISAGLGAVVGFAGGFISTGNIAAAALIGIASAAVSGYYAYQTGEIVIVYKKS